jgi:hypothetical protein
MKKLYKQVVCKDGTKISVQASSYHYCSPRIDVGPYTEVECGYPTAVPNDRMLSYAEDSDKPLETVYGWVPISLVWEFILDHGGMVDGELPPGFPEVRDAD